MLMLMLIMSWGYDPNWWRGNVDHESAFWSKDLVDHVGPIHIVEWDMTLFWVLKRFTKESTIGGKQQISIFIDQNQAVTNANKEVFPKSWHRLCLWHISQNAKKDLLEFIAIMIFIKVSINAYMGVWMQWSLSQFGVRWLRDISNKIMIGLIGYIIFKKSGVQVLV